MKQRTIKEINALVMSPKTSHPTPPTKPPKPCVHRVVTVGDQGVSDVDMAWIDHMLDKVPDNAYGDHLFRHLVDFYMIFIEIAFVLNETTDVVQRLSDLLHTQRLIQRNLKAEVNTLFELIREYVSAGKEDKQALDAMRDSIKWMDRRLDVVQHMIEATEQMLTDMRPQFTSIERQLDRLQDFAYKDVMTTDTTSGVHRDKEVKELSVRFKNRLRLSCT